MPSKFKAAEFGRSHRSVVQTFASSQSGSPTQPSTQLPDVGLQCQPAPQVSVNAHPMAGTQAAEVQAIPSSQITAVPGTQAPASRWSNSVHASPSEQPFVSSGVFAQPVSALQLSSV